MEHWAWRAAEHSMETWKASLPDDHEVFDLDMLYQWDAFFAAHADGWSSHPEQPQALYEQGALTIRAGD